MNKETILNELKTFINNSINSRLKNDLPVIKEQLINKANIYLSLLNDEYKTSYIFDITSLVNNELYKDVTKQELSYNEVVNKIQSITNTYYNYSQIEMDLIEGSDNIGYNDINLYLSNGYEDIKINFRYMLTSEYDIIVYSIN